jgi:Thiamine pyrophosphate enzyme, N-terminal TPP binding domain
LTQQELKAMRKLVADIFVGTLQSAGVRHCYGIVGDTLNLIARSLERSEIEWVSERHEEAGAFAAQAEAQVADRLTAVAGSCGPGRTLALLRPSRGATGGSAHLPRGIDVLWRIRSSPIRIVDANTLSGFARNSAESVYDFAGVVRNLILDVRDSYRPEVHDMRGPGPKWLAKHRPWSTFDSEAIPPGGRTHRR